MRGLVLFASTQAMEDALVDFIEIHVETIKKFRITTTTTALERVRHLLGDQAVAAIGVESSLMGGDAQVATQVVLHDVGAAFIWDDPIDHKAAQADCDALLRLLNVHNIMTATNPASAEALILVLQEAMATKKVSERRKILPSFFESLESPAVFQYKAKQNAVIASCQARATDSSASSSSPATASTAAPAAVLGKFIKTTEAEVCKDTALKPRAANVTCTEEVAGTGGTVSREAAAAPPPRSSVITFADKGQFAKELFSTPTPDVPLETIAEEAAKRNAGSAALSMVVKAHTWRARAHRLQAKEEAKPPSPLKQMVKRWSRDGQEDAPPTTPGRGGVNPILRRGSSQGAPLDELAEDSLKKRMNKWKANLGDELSTEISKKANEVAAEVSAEDSSSFHDKAGNQMRAKQMRCLALVSHNNMKGAMQDFVKRHASVLKMFRLTGTNSTMTMLKSVLGEDDVVYGPTCSSGPLGGDAELVAQMCVHGLGGVIFFTDPLEPHPHTADISALVRMTNLHNIVHASNPTTADALTRILAKGLDEPMSIPTFFVTGLSPAIEAHQAEAEEKERRLAQPAIPTSALIGAAAVGFGVCATVMLAAGRSSRR